jgi:hypothetical protein
VQSFERQGSKGVIRFKAFGHALKVLSSLTIKCCRCRV